METGLKIAEGEGGPSLARAVREPRSRGREDEQTRERRVRAHLMPYWVEPNGRFEITDLNFDDESEVGFAATTWKHILGKGNSADEWMPPKARDKKMRAILKKLRYRKALWLAVRNVEDPSQLFGWLVGEWPVVHFMFVKQPFRKHGVGKALLNLFAKPKDVQLYATTWTPMAKRLFEKFNIKRVDL